MRTVSRKQNQVSEGPSADLTRAKVAAPEADRAAAKFARPTSNRVLGQLLAGNVKVARSQKQSLNNDVPAEGNRTGLPRKLKAGIETLSGIAMDDVRVHYNSAKPAAVRALAHTRGADIFVGPGQEKHLPHEAWHVVQQKQGRVTPGGMMLKGSAINVESRLEKEADRMGAAALNVNAVSPGLVDTRARLSESYQNQVVQRQKVPTDFGEFETTTFNPLNDSGVDIVLMFNPDKAKIDAEKIALTQTVRSFNEAGRAYAINPTMGSRMVPKGKGAGYTVDASGETNNPLYFDIGNLGLADDLKDTPESANKSGAATVVGSNTHYQIGYCFKEKPADPDKKTQAAGLSDKPQGIQRRGAGMMFETTALATAGADQGKYYGSVKWGYKVGGTKAKPKVEAKNIFDITAASKGTPTANFIAAAKLWNAGTTKGTLVVNPTSVGDKRTAFITYLVGTGPKRLAKGTKLKQLNVIKGSTDPMIEAEVLDASGNGTNVTVQIYVADVKDAGDGAANRQLPIPASKP